MIVGVPKEIKQDERRVAITPWGVHAFVAKGHTVLVEERAGEGTGIPDSAYTAEGAMLAARERVWGEAEMLLKVKEPVETELDLLRPGQILFTYLHLAASRELTVRLLEAGVVALGYETVQFSDGTLPLLAPMSEVAGRLAVQAGAYCLEAVNGGKGILLGGVSGVKPAQVVILGAGVAGANACAKACGVGARVTILDIDPRRLSYVRDIMQSHVTTLMSNDANIRGEVRNADLVISTVLIPGARTPRLLTRELLSSMEPGSALVDVSVDQGGTAETSRPTTHHDPCYRECGVVHYCVANMPGVVPRTSTYALTNVTLRYALELADLGYRKAIESNEALAKGLNLVRGEVRNAAVAAAHGL
jgi:alanine dehydrogenase